MFNVYSASAGSGKTYTLTKEYLRLALSEGHTLTNPPSAFKPNYFRRILAITFTNAAANEMKERILRELKRISGMPPDWPDLPTLEAQPDTGFLIDLTRSLMATPPTAEVPLAQVKEVQRRCKQLFKAILHRYSDFSVTTIDSFTQRLVTAFTDELGLPYSFEVEMDTQLALELAVDSLVERVGADDMTELTEVLHEIFADTAVDGGSWRAITTSLQEFGQVLTSDQHYEAVGRITALTPAQVRAVRQKIQAFELAATGRIQGHARQAMTGMADAGLDSTSFKYGGSGIGGFFKAIAEGDTFKEPGKNVQKTVADQDWYGSKITAPTKQRIDALMPDLMACYEGIRHEQTTTGMQVALYADIQKHLQKMALLAQIRDEFVTLLRLNNQVHISEFNKRIKAIVETEPVPFLFERLGSKYNHILIDEFQDTSQLQFANLMPLIENALSSGHDNLAVGDGKQAIYRFRGGDMDQIVALHTGDMESLQRQHGPETWTAERLNTLNGLIQPQKLESNFRSAKPIVAFNNAFFSEVARHCGTDDVRLGSVYDALESFHQIPAPHAAETAHIQIDFIQADDLPDKQELPALMVARTVAHIRQALAEGYTYQDIAVLFRKTKEAKLVANELNRQGIPLVSADSLSLRYSDPIRFLVALLTMICRPGQPALRYEVLYLYHLVVHHRVPTDAQTEELRDVADSKEEFPVFDYLGQQGYTIQALPLAQLTVYELTERLAHLFRLFDQPHDHPFLFRFLDEILTFCSRQSGHLADFLRYWETARDKVSVSEGGATNAVTIQTIHKAKGLEYPVVIVPFANWSSEPHNNSQIWVDLQDVPTPELSIIRPDGTEGRLLNAQIPLTARMKTMPHAVAHQHAEELSRTLLENINLLYVAFTRPTQRLYVLAAETKRDKLGVATWLRQFLASKTAVDAVSTHEMPWQKTILTEQTSTSADTHSTTEKAQENVDLQAFSTGTRGQDMQLRRMAERVFDTRTFEQHRERDRKLCAALSLIKGQDCLAKTLDRLVREGLIRAVETDDLHTGLLAIVTHPDLADAFGYDRRIDTDRTILARKQAKGAPHRVVHCPDGRVLLVQYESLPDAGAEKPISFLPAFISLYTEMGYPRVEGRVVWLGNVPVVEHV